MCLLTCGLPRKRRAQLSLQLVEIETRVDPNVSSDPLQHLASVARFFSDPSSSETVPDLVNKAHQRRIVRMEPPPPHEKSNLAER